MSQMNLTEPPYPGTTIVDLMTVEIHQDTPLVFIGWEQHFVPTIGRLRRDRQRTGTIQQDQYRTFDQPRPGAGTTVGMPNAVPGGITMYPALALTDVHQVETWDPGMITDLYRQPLIPGTVVAFSSGDVIHDEATVITSKDLTLGTVTGVQHGGGVRTATVTVEVIARSWSDGNGEYHWSDNIPYHQQGDTAGMNREGFHTVTLRRYDVVAVPGIAGL